MDAHGDGGVRAPQQFLPDGLPLHRPHLAVQPVRLQSGQRGGDRRGERRVRVLQLRAQPRPGVGGQRLGASPAEAEPDHRVQGVRIHDRDHHSANCCCHV
jgi:hypothetical protein